MELLYSAPRLGTIGSVDCTPGYYNNEGQGGGVDWFLGYPGGAMAYFEYLDQWRNQGDFTGLEFR
jgi:cyclohexanone monooxygenase